MTELLALLSLSWTTGTTQHLLQGQGNQWNGWDQTFLLRYFKDALGRNIVIGARMWKELGISCCKVLTGVYWLWSATVVKLEFDFVQSGSGTDPAFWIYFCGVKATGVWSWPLTSLWCRELMCGAMHPFLFTTAGLRITWSLCFYFLEWHECLTGCSLGKGSLLVEFRTGSYSYNKQRRWTLYCLCN